MARTVESVAAEQDFQRDFIRGAARIMIADMTQAFPTALSDMVYTTTASNASEVQTVTVTGTPTGGTFTMSFKGYTSGAIAYNATAAAVKTALEALATIGTGGVTTTGGPLPGTPVVITFANQLANMNVPTLTATASFTGGTTPTIAITVTTPGIGIWDSKTGWLDLGPTLGGITINRNNAEETFSVDQIQADIMTLPNNWEVNVSASMSRADIDTIQYLWEGGTITIDGVTGERTLPLGTPTGYRQKRLAVLYQRQSIDAGVTPGLVRAYCFRKTQRTPQESSVTHNKEGAQTAVAFTWKALADTTVSDSYARFGSIIDQA
jgi:hypothetical protein